MQSLHPTQLDCPNDWGGGGYLPLSLYSPKFHPIRDATPVIHVKKRTNDSSGLNHRLDASEVTVPANSCLV